MGGGGAWGPLLAHGLPVIVSPNVLVLSGCQGGPLYGCLTSPGGSAAVNITTGTICWILVTYCQWNLKFFIRNIFIAICILCYYSRFWANTIKSGLIINQIVQYQFFCMEYTHFLLGIVLSKWYHMVTVDSHDGSSHDLQQYFSGASESELTLK